MELGGGALRRLDKIPEVAVEVFEDGDCPVWFDAGWAHYDYGMGVEVFDVAVDVVGVEEEEDAAACLEADGGELLFGGGFCEKQAAAGGAWSDDYPAFGWGERGIFQEEEIEFVDVEIDGFVVVSYEEGYLCDGAVHGGGFRGVKIGNWRVAELWGMGRDLLGVVGGRGGGIAPLECQVFPLLVWRLLRTFIKN